MGLLIARGWGIVGDRIREDKFVIAGAVLLLNVSQIVGILWGGLLQFLLLGSYAFIVFLIFAYVNQSILKLDEQHGNPEVNLIGKHLYGVNVIDKKIGMLRKFNVLMVVFCVAQITIVGLETLIFYNKVWITQLLLELTDLLMFMVIALIFRLRKENIYYRLEGAGGNTTEKPKPREEKITWASVEQDATESVANPLSVQLVPGMAEEWQPRVS